jgi:Protein of unknown function (DUF3187)
MRPAGVALCLLASASGRCADFLPTKNENPLLRGLYLPLPSAARAADPTALGVALSITNTVNVENRSQEHLFIDGESATLRLSIDAALAAAWRYRLILPVSRDSGGFLDSTIDAWHQFFGLPRGQRPNYPNNQLRYFYSGSVVDINSPQTHVGDLAMEAGWFARDRDTQTVSVWGGIEVPTGSARAATGDGAWDAALWVHAAARAVRWQFAGELGIARPIGEKLFGGNADRTAAFARVAASWNASSAWCLRAQLEGVLSRLQRTQLRFLGPSAVFAIGAAVQTTPRWRIDFGFTEDIAVNTAPDIEFFLAVTAKVGNPH